MSLKAHAARRPEQFRPDLAASAERANLARFKARARTRLGFHNRREVSKSHFAAVHESGIDAVDASSTGTSVPWMWALLRLPRFRGASHANNNENRFNIAKSVFQVHGVKPTR
jgi:hypothetical protein